MTGVEPRTSDIESDRSTNWATTISPPLLRFMPPIWMDLYKQAVESISTVLSYAECERVGNQKAWFGWKIFDISLYTNYEYKHWAERSGQHFKYFHWARVAASRKFTCIIAFGIKHTFWKDHIQQIRDN